MQPITAAEIEAVHDICERAGVVIDESDEATGTLAAIVRPAMNALPEAHVCETVFTELMIILTMGISIGAHVVEQRSLNP